MKFCQIDGTPLEAAAEEAPFDPYATMVSSPSKPIVPPAEEPVDILPPAETDSNLSMSSVPISEPDEVLDLPQHDPLKTMMVSSEELEQAMASEEKPAQDEPAMPTPPASLTPEVEESQPATTGTPTPPPSPFSTTDEPTPVSEPSPVFDQPAASEPAWDDAATIVQPQVNVPFEPPAPVQEWTPPPAPDAAWQNQQIGSNTPFQAPPAGVGGQNKTLAIVSLVLGILSICCYVAPLTGAAALVTGWMATKNIKKDPNTYGGKGLATAGMITGGIFFVLGIVYYIYIIFVLGFAAMTGGFQ